MGRFSNSPSCLMLHTIQALILKFVGGMVTRWSVHWLWTGWSRFKAWSGSLCCVLEQDTLLPRCLSSPWSILDRYLWIVRVTLENAGGSPGPSLRAGQWVNWPAKRMVLPTWFEHLEEHFSYREIQFKKFCPPVKTSYPPSGNIDETPGSPCDELASHPGEVQWQYS